MVIKDIKKYAPKAMDNFFFDNNVWIYLFCPIGNHDKKNSKYILLFFKIYRLHELPFGLMD